MVVIDAGVVEVVVVVFVVVVSLKLKRTKVAVYIRTGGRNSLSE